MRTVRLRIVLGGGAGVVTRSHVHVPGGGGVLWPGPMSRSGGGGRGCCDTRPLVLTTSPPLFSDRMTNTCKNITFARYTTRAVINSWSKYYLIPNWNSRWDFIKVVASLLYGVEACHASRCFFCEAHSSVGLSFELQICDVTEHGRFRSVRHI